MARFLVAFALFTFAISVSSVIAQETDNYDDYSYLWEEESKQKKKKRSKKNGETSEVTPVTTTTPSDSLAQQAIPTDTIPDDSLINEEPLAVDTTDNYYDDPFGEEEVKKEEPKKERVDADPVEDFRTPMSSEVGSGSFIGGFTYTQIAGEDFVGLVLAPEFSIGKVGVGLNVPVLYGLDSKKIRTEIFEDGVGAARLIRYIRYGRQKVDPVYIKVGELNGLMLGFGGLINNYTNTTSYEKRKVGLHYDVNYENFIGIEGLYSDFDPSSLNLFAIRPYIRPLARTPIPVARTLEIGATYVTDKDQTDIPLTDSTALNYIFTAEGISAFGLDMGISVFRSPFIQIDVFANYSKLNLDTDSLRLYSALFFENSDFKNGSGVSFGANFRMHFIADVFKTDVRIERLSYTENYLPQFFDASYELNKDTRISSVLNAEKMSGIYGSLTGHVLQKVQLGGSLMIPDNVSETAPALVRVHADLDRLMDKFTMNASYIKTGLADLSDAFKLDDRSLAKIRFIYHMNRFLATGVDYYYYWEPNELGEYRAVNYVMPYFGLSIDF